MGDDLRSETLSSAKLAKTMMRIAHRRAYEAFLAASINDDVVKSTKFENKTASLNPQPDQSTSTEADPHS